MFTLGEVPYHREVEDDKKLMDFIEKGNRLAKPDYSNQEIYDIMLDCWNMKKTERPSFSDLSIKFSNMHEIAVNSKDTRTRIETFTIFG